MNEVAELVRERTADNPATLVINGKEITGFAEPPQTFPGGDGEAAESQVNIGYIGEPPQEGGTIGHQDRRWSISEFTQYGDAVTGTITSRENG